VRGRCILEQKKARKGGRNQKRARRKCRTSGTSQSRTATGEKSISNYLKGREALATVSND